VLVIDFFFTWTIRYVNHNPKWEYWDTVFIATLTIAVVLPTWTVYMAPCWQVPAAWSVVALTVAYFAPHTVPPAFTPIRNKSLQYAIAGTSCAIAWMTYMMIFVESHWRQAM
jgi:hypothetical protein